MSKMTDRFFVLILSALSAVAMDSSIAFSQQSPRSANDANPAKLSLRVYDVRDLVMVVPDHKLDADKSPTNPGGGAQQNAGGGGGFGGGGVGLPQPYHAVSPEPQGPQPIEIGRLIDVITQTVAPDSWYGPQGIPGGP